MFWAISYFVTMFSKSCLLNYGGRRIKHSSRLYKELTYTENNKYPNILHKQHQINIEISQYIVITSHDGINKWYIKTNLN